MNRQIVFFRQFFRGPSAAISFCNPLISLLQFPPVTGQLAPALLLPASVCGHIEISTLYVTLQFLNQFLSGSTAFAFTYFMRAPP